jgi:hypothetical protein
MASMEIIPDTIRNWENGKLGTDEAHVQVAPVGHDEVLDEALGLVTLSVRLNKVLAEQFEAVCLHHGMTTQAFLRMMIDARTTNWLDKNQNCVTD